MATKNVGSGGDYANMAAYSSYVNALNFTAPEVCNILSAGGAVADSTAVTIGGYTGSSGTNTLTIQPVSGQGFADNVNAQTNALRYNASNGAALNSTAGYADAYTLSGANMIVQGLQFQNATNSAKCITGMVSSSTVRRNIINSRGSNTALQGDGMTTEYNVITVQGGSNGIVTFSNTAINNNAIFAPSGSSGTGIIQLYTSGTIARSNVIAGFATDYSGTVSASSSNNATDKGSFGGTNWGGSGQTSITASSEWQSVTAGSEDLRLKSTSPKLKDNGSSAGPSTDIVGTSVPQGSARDIGPWEYLSASTDYPVSNTEAITAGHSQSVALGVASTITEATALAHTQSIVAAISAAINEPATLADTLSAVLNRDVSITEAAALAESANRALGIASAITEVATLVETEDAAKSLGGTITEAASLAETELLVFGAAPTITEAAALSHTQSVQASLSAAQTEAASLDSTQNATASGDYAATITEETAMSHTQTVQAALSAAQTETAALADSQSVQAALSAAISESAPLAHTQAASAAGDYSVTATEAATLADVASTIFGIFGAVTEAADLQAPQAASSPGNYSGSITEEMALADGASVQRGLYVSLIESCNAADSCLINWSYMAGLMEACTLGALQSAFLSVPSVRDFTRDISHVSMRTDVVHVSYSEQIFALSSNPGIVVGH